MTCQLRLALYDTTGLQRYDHNKFGESRHAPPFFKCHFLRKRLPLPPSHTSVTSWVHVEALSGCGAVQARQDQLFACVEWHGAAHTCRPALQIISPAKTARISGG